METYIAKKEGEKLYLFRDEEKVGEISPDATWVKEGMEFDDKDIRLCMYNDNMLLDIADSYDEFLTHGYYEAHKDETKLIIEIKGPCGYFH